MAMFKQAGTVVRRGGPKLIPCEGSGTPARTPLDPGRATCPVCRQAKPIYDSSRLGRGLLVDHERKESATTHD